MIENLNPEMLEKSISEFKYMKNTQAILKLELLK